MTNLRFDPELIAYTCSPRHVQSVLEDLLEILKVAKELQDEVLSLNPNCPEIGLGKLANLQSIANRMNIAE